jgi:predicted lipoprotein with Yx(FWY)xxD motif
MMRNRWLAAPVLAAAFIGLAACGSSTPSSSNPPAAPAATSSSSSPATSTSGSVIKTASSSFGTILVNSAGHAIYWFAIDTPTKSNCSGTCAGYWTPVKGPVTAAAGVSLPGTFGTITRADGTIQATYKGHPLYTYVADSSMGMVSGNGKNLSGGLWWVMTPSAKVTGKAAPAPSTSTSSGGYGY